MHFGPSVAVSVSAVNFHGFDVHSAWLFAQLPTNRSAALAGGSFSAWLAATPFDSSTVTPVTFASAVTFSLAPAWFSGGPGFWLHPAIRIASASPATRRITPAPSPTPPHCGSPPRIRGTSARKGGNARDRAVRTR